MKILAHVPARSGSKRLKSKNLLPMGGIPLIAHVIQAGLASRHITDLYINTESDIIAQVGSAYGAKVYKRDPLLAQDEVTQDTFNFDFIKQMRPDVLVLLNPVCPLIETQDIDEVLTSFLAGPYDAVVTTSDYQSFAMKSGEAINFNPHHILPRTQDVPAVRLLNFAISAWRAEAFMAQFTSHGHACLLPRTLYYPLPKDKGIKISDAEDFKMAQAILALRGS